MVIFSNLNQFNLTKIDLENIIEIDFQNFKGINIWDKEDFLYYITNKNYLFSVIKKDGCIVGFCLSFISSFESELYKIAIKKDFQNLGLAKLLLILHLACLNLKGIKVSYLEVNVNNYKAINLYKKIGYKEIKKREKYYYNKEDALVMKLELRIRGLSNPKKPLNNGISPPHTPFKI